ncbi:hypothetical protein SAZ11_46160 [Streptomyces sp. FXJ1.4098]|uniref:hypothetical protein n=1 Tax=Streptomyces sp. NPDC020845 TaxID=3365096 RepID=UPI0029999D03|nr:hypothetical protein [Streptomyces sp. FXJ1.4098]
MTVPLRRLVRIRAGGLAALAAAFLLVVTEVAWAAVTDNMYPTYNASRPCRDDPDGGDGILSCQTDNREVYYYMDSGGTYELESPDRTIVSDMLRDDYAPTDLARHYDSSPTFSGDAETDIIYQEGSTNIGSSSDGVTWCNDAVDARRCDQQYIRIRGNGYYTPGLSCHETGHAVGLTHGQQADPKLNQTDSRLGCLQTPVSYGTGLGANNRENINGAY